MKKLAVATLFLIGISGLGINADGQWPLGREAAQLVKTSEMAQPLMMTGRYQIVVSPYVKGHTFMIDTETGRMWHMKKDSTTGEFSLQRIPVEHLDVTSVEKSVPAKPAPHGKDEAGTR